MYHLALLVLLQLCFNVRGLLRRSPASAQANEAAAGMSFNKWGIGGIYQLAPEVALMGAAEGTGIGAYPCGTCRADSCSHAVG